MFASIRAWAMLRSPMSRSENCASPATTSMSRRCCCVTFALHPYPRSIADLFSSAAMLHSSDSRHASEHAAPHSDEKSQISSMAALVRTSARQQHPDAACNLPKYPNGAPPMACTQRQTRLSSTLSSRCAPTCGPVMAHAERAGIVRPKRHIASNPTPSPISSSAVTLWQTHQIRSRGQLQRDLVVRSEFPKPQSDQSCLDGLHSEING